MARLTISASRAFHQTASPASTATPVPTATGTTAAGRVRGRAPASHCPGVATHGFWQSPREGRVPGHLPEVAVRVREVAGVDPEGVHLGGGGDAGPGRLGLGE